MADSFVGTRLFSLVGRGRGRVNEALRCALIRRSMKEKVFTGVYFCLGKEISCDNVEPCVSTFRTLTYDACVAIVTCVAKTDAC